MRIRLGSLLDDHPANAGEEARALSFGSSASEMLFTGLKGSILIDAASSTDDMKAIDGSVALFEGLLKTHPEGAVCYRERGCIVRATRYNEPHGHPRYPPRTGFGPE